MILKASRLPENVDLMTPSRKLEDVLISNFPGVIKPKQCSNFKFGHKDSIYCFGGLKTNLLLDFLKNYSEPYELRDPSSGNVLLEVGRFRG